MTFHQLLARKVTRLSLLLNLTFHLNVCDYLSAFRAQNVEPGEASKDIKVVACKSTGIPLVQEALRQSGGYNEAFW